MITTGSYGHKSQSHAKVDMIMTGSYRHNGHDHDWVLQALKVVMAWLQKIAWRTGKPLPFTWRRDHLKLRGRCRDSKGNDKLSSTEVEKVLSHCPVLQEAENEETDDVSLWE